MSFFNESPAEMAFRYAEPIFHLYTAPIETEVFFTSDAERVLATNYIAIAISVSNCKLLAYAIMTNHFHFVLEGREEAVLEFYEKFRNLFDKYLRKHGRGPIMDQATPGITAINNLKQLRDEIAYVLRNPFVVMADVNVFAYPWTSGNLYFNPFLEKKGKSASTLSLRAIRDITKSRNITSLDSSLYFEDGQAQPWSFVDYTRAELFFDNARQFIFSVLRNVESQVEIALSHGEIPVLCDEELIPLIYALSKEQLRAESPYKLDVSGKKQLAVLVKNKYHSSNKQIARLVKLPLAEVNKLFPLAAPAPKP